jgi:hypothetical protein
LADRPQAPPLSEVLARLASELHTATDLADHCQAAVGEIMAQNVQHDAALRLQALDMLTQHLSDLGRVLESLAQAAPHAPDEIFDGVRLADLKRRLRGEAALASDESDDEFW